MDFGKAFTYVFDDEEWIQKIAIGGLLALTGIGLIPLIGWGIEITRRIIRGEGESLPDWNDFGGYITRGLFVFIILFVYMLPIMVLQSCSLIPLAFESADQDTFTTAFTVMSTCVSCVTFLYSIAAYLVLPAAIGLYADTDKLGDAFKFGDVIKIVRLNFETYLVVFLGVLLSSLISSLGLIACFVGVFLTTAYAVAINGHLWGQAYALSKSVLQVDPSEPIPDAD
jgi:hypothetical protein